MSVVAVSHIFHEDHEPNAHEGTSLTLLTHDTLTMSLKDTSIVVLQTWPVDRYGRDEANWK